MSVDSNQRLEYLYKEYVRLSDKAEDFIKSTYDDFKLFGVIGAIIVVWKPISEFVLSANSNLDPSMLLFLGFLSLLIAVGIIALMNLIKQSYTWYFVHNLQVYEMEIRKELGEAEDSEIFNFNLGKEEQRFVIAVYRLPFRAFLICFIFAIVFIPFVILCHSNIGYAVIYLLTACLSFFFIYVQIFRRIIKQFSSATYF